MYRIDENKIKNKLLNNIIDCKNKYYFSIANKKNSKNVIYEHFFCKKCKILQVLP